MGIQTINNGDSGLTVRTAINANFVELHGLSIGQYDLRYDAIAADDIYTTHIGAGAGVNADKDAIQYCTAIGVHALRSKTGGGDCVAIGRSALGSDTAGWDHTAVGNDTLANLTDVDAIGCTAVGKRSLYSVTTGGMNTGCGDCTLEYMTSGECNTAVGYSALFGLTTGGYNTAIGRAAGRSVTSGNTNLFLGESAGYHANQATTVSNSVAIGPGSYTTESNQIAMGSASIDTFVMLGPTTHISKFNRIGIGGTNFTLLSDTLNYLTLGPDVVNPSAKYLAAPSVLTGTADTAASDLNFASGRGTGTGAGGAIAFYVAPAGSTGSTQNPLQVALSINSAKYATFYGPVTLPASNVLLFSGQGGLKSYGNGVFAFRDTNGTSFTSLHFGPNTSSFPSLRVNSTTLECKLGDNSAYTNVKGKITTDTAYAAGDPTTTGYLTIYDSTGTAYKIPAVAA